MLSSFDWIRRSRTGAELLATLRCLALEEKRGAKDKEQRIENIERKVESEAQLSSTPSIGPPVSATKFPCQRCWTYPRMSGSDYKDDPYCKFCAEILKRTPGLGRASRGSVIIWGFGNRLPEQLENERPESRHGSYALRLKPFLAGHVYNGNRFLLMIYRRQLRDWLRELILHEGTTLKGLIQIFPTMGLSTGIAMGDILCRAVHHEANFPLDQLRVRFYSEVHQLLQPHVRDRKGMLTFEASEFLSLMEMAMVFRKLLRPEEQKELYELLNIDNSTEEQFYWGRFSGRLSQEAKDMLNAWKIRNWPKDRVRLLYEIIKYVFIPEFH